MLSWLLLANQKQAFKTIQTADQSKVTHNHRQTFLKTKINLNWLYFPTGLCARNEPLTLETGQPEKPTLRHQFIGQKKHQICNKFDKCTEWHFEFRDVQNCKQSN